MTQSEFARLCGIGIQAWNNAENAYARIGLDNANRVRERTGVSLDFIYHGNRHGMPHSIAIELERLERVERKAS